VSRDFVRERAPAAAIRSPAHKLASAIAHFCRDATRATRPRIAPAFVAAVLSRPGLRGCLCPKPALRAMPARLLLLCLLFRASSLTAGRRVGVAGVLHRRGGRAAIGVRVGVVRAFRTSSLGCAKRLAETAAGSPKEPSAGAAVAARLSQDQKSRRLKPRLPGRRSRERLQLSESFHDRPVMPWPISTAANTSSTTAVTTALFPSSHFRQPPRIAAALSPIAKNTTTGASTVLAPITM